MKRPHITEEYDNEVEDFLKFTKENAPDIGGVYFSCVKCLNGRQQFLDDIRTHLIYDGICPTYGMVSYHKCHQPLRLVQLMNKSVII